MGGRAPAQQTQTNRVELSPEQQQLFNLALPYARQYAEQPLATYEGQTIAGFNPTELAARAGYVSGAAPRGSELGDQAALSQLFMLNPNQLNPETNPYLQGVAAEVSRGIGDQFTQRILPNIRAEGIDASGMYGGGSTREQMAERLAAEGVLRETGTALNNLYFQNYQTGLNNMARAIQMNPSVQAQQLFGSDVLAAVGGQERALEQARLDEALRRWSIEQGLPFMRATEILSLLQGMPGATGITTMQGARPITNPITGALGGAASGAALGSVVPGIGTAIGALGGAVLGGAGGYFGSR